MKKTDTFFGRLQKRDMPLYEALSEYAGTGIYPFHMPGHKRRMGRMDNPFSFDITEVYGFDDLHHPEEEGILGKLQERAARVYGSRETHYLVNGSTSGILTAVSAVCAGRASRDKAPCLLTARNCHRSVYHALYLNRASAVYLYPGRWEKDPQAGIAGRIRPEDVRMALEEAGNDPALCGVVITSPTYDGVVSDVEAIANIAHSFGLPLIVDEAHGAHFGMHPDLPPSSVSLGADLVIHSIHKTLPSLTQTALLHVNGSLVDPGLVRRFLSVYQTSSPSYVLMAGMDQCIRFLEREIRKAPDASAFGRWLAMLQDFYSACAPLRGLKIVRTDDPGKILIRSRDGDDRAFGAGDGEGRGTLSGSEICDTLRESFALETEMAAADYALCISTVADTREGLTRLADALRCMDQDDAGENAQAERKPETGRNAQAERKPKSGETGCAKPENSELMQGGLPAAQKPEWQVPRDCILPIHAAWDGSSQSICLEMAAGRISTEFVYLYPPGIPLLVPGERIGAELAAQLAACRKKGCTIHGLSDKDARNIRVLRQESPVFKDGVL